MHLPVGILLAIVGLGMLGFWIVHIRNGGLPDGLRSLESGGFIAFHIGAESLTGISCLVGGIALAMALPWGKVLALLACGMLLYTSINSLAWKEVRNKPSVSMMFIVPAVIAVIGIIYLALELLPAM